MIFVVAFVSLEWTLYHFRQYALLHLLPKAIDVVWIWTTHEIPLVSLHLRIGTSVMIFCCLSVGYRPAVYLTCIFTQYLEPLPYLTLYFISAKWGREESNLYCLPLGNWFTVSRNTANRCRFPRIIPPVTVYTCRVDFHIKGVLLWKKLAYF